MNRLYRKHIYGGKKQEDEISLHETTNFVSNLITTSRGSCITNIGNRFKWSNYLSKYLIVHFKMILEFFPVTPKLQNNQTRQGYNLKKIMDNLHPIKRTVMIIFLSKSFYSPTIKVVCQLANKNSYFSEHLRWLLLLVISVFSEIPERIMYNKMYKYIIEHTVNYSTINILDSRTTTQQRIISLI